MDVLAFSLFTLRQKKNNTQRKGVKAVVEFIAIFNTTSDISLIYQCTWADKHIYLTLTELSCPGSCVLDVLGLGSIYSSPVEVYKKLAGEFSPLKSPHDVQMFKVSQLPCDHAGSLRCWVGSEELKWFTYST